MSDDGRLSLLRLRAFARRLAVPVSDRFAHVEAMVEGLAGIDGRLPLVGADPFAGLGETPPSPLPDRDPADRQRGQTAAEGRRGPGVPPDVDSEPAIARRGSTSSFSWPTPTPGAEPPRPAPEEPIGLGLVAELIARIDSSAPFAAPPMAGSPPVQARIAAEGTAEGAGSSFRPTPPPDRAKFASWPATLPATLPETLAGREPGSGLLQNGGHFSTASWVSPPSASPGEPVGLGLVASLLARIDSNGAPSSARRDTAAATRTALEHPRSGQNRQQPPPRQAQPPGNPAAPTADHGALTSAPFVERPSLQSPAAEPSFASEDRRVPPPPILPRNAEQDAPTPAAKAAATAAPAAAVSPFETARAASPALDPDLLADLVNDALVAQAARSGVDLS